MIACHECDLLQRETVLEPGSKALCTRCGATLYRSHRHSVGRSLAFALGGLMLFALTAAYPIVSLELGGQRVAATLLDPVRAFYKNGMQLLAALVLTTAVLVPLAQLAAICMLMLPLRRGGVPRMAGPAARFLHAVEGWGMIDVFLLGVLVAMAKLAQLAHAVPGIALWSTAGLVVLVAGIGATFDPRTLWTRA